MQELQSILTALGYLPRRTELDPARDWPSATARRRSSSGASRALYDAEPRRPRGHRKVAVGHSTARPAIPRSFDRLDALLDDQAYRPAYWRVAAEEINYRRFFDINDLAAIRVELPEVFEATHQLVFRLLAEGKVTGLRIDHPDGLWDPPATSAGCRRATSATGSARADAARGPGAAQAGAGRRAAWRQLVAGRGTQASRRTRSSSWPLYVVAEKILSEGERLPQDWAVHGTTGYDFLNAGERPLRGRAASAEAFDRALRAVHREAGSASATWSNSTKKMIMLVSLASEINALAHQLERIADRANRRYRDFTLNSLTFALREVIASLPVYRTYITDSAERAGSTISATWRRPWPRPSGATRARPRPSSTSSATRCSCATCRSFREEDRQALVALRDEVPAGHRPGDGQGRGGHRLLRLQPAGLAERGGRPPRPVRRLRGRLPPAERRAAAGYWPTPCWPPRPTTPSAARTCGPASTCSRRCPTSGQGGPAPGAR